jgi:predicted Fe-S protein YdhL (DUF1289 family)
MTAVPAKPASPCVRQCKLADDKSHCLSCLRTRDEITAWGRMSDPERTAIMATLSTRRAEQAVQE